MAKILKHLVFGQKKNPPAPPRPDYEGEKKCSVKFSDHDYENLPKFAAEGCSGVQFQEKKEPKLVVFENYSEPADLRAEIDALKEQEENDPLYMAPVDDACQFKATAPEEEEDMYCIPYEDQDPPPPLPNPCLPPGFISQKLGRKSVLMYISLSFMTSWLLIAYSRSLLYVYAGRLISGFSAGIASVAVPAYVVEIATTEKRGFLTSGFQVFYSSGVLVMMSLGIVLRWSWLAVTAAIFVVSGAILMFFMPESPAWLVRESRCAEAIRGLMFLRGKNVDYVREIEEINDSMREHSSRGIRFQDFLQPTLYKPIVIVFLLFFFQQFSGINSLMSYTVDILKNAGSAIDPFTAAAIVSVVQLLVTMTSSLLMDRAGRKVLFIVSGCFLFLSLTTLGLHSIAVQKYNFDQAKYGWVPVMAFVVYVAAYAIGFGPIPFVMTPELVPIHTRSFLLAMGSVTCSGLGFVVAKSFDSLKTLMGEYGLYWAYAAFSLLGSLYCFFFIQETKGRTIQEINSSFSASS